MSFFSFNIIGNALNAYQEAQNVVSDNISNVSTPGASQQEAVISEADPISASPFYAAHISQPGTQGEGSVVNQITRIHQDSYDTSYRDATSSEYYYTNEQQQLSTVQSAFGEPNSGVNAAFSALQTAITGAAASPTSESQRQDVLQAAQALTSKLNSASQAITDQESSDITQGKSLVTQANTLIDQIGSLNGQIRALKAAGDNPNTYLDERDHAIDELSQLVPVQTTLQPNGSSLVTVNGEPLVSDTVTYHLASPVVSTDSSGSTKLVIGFANDPDPSHPTPISLGSGALGAITDVYNNKLIPYGQQLDNFASSAASEMNRITEAGVDYNGNAGTALFSGGAPGQPITAANIGVAITNPTQLPLALLSTAAGSLTQAMNSANNTVSTSAAIDGNATLKNPPSGALTGTLTVAVDGVTQNFSYNTGNGGNADTIADFVQNFNAGHYGVTASFDSTSQKIVFARDPTNIDAVHRGLQGSNAATASFTISDSNGPAAGTTESQGTAATGLLEALGATNINGVAQTPSNAFGSSDNGVANALTTLFTQNVGVGALQTTAAAVSTTGTGVVTITQPAGAPGAFSTVNVGQILTVVNATTGTTQNVAVTAVNRNTGTITVRASAPINVDDPIMSAQTQTLGAAYGSLVTQMGLDVSNAGTGVSTQTSLASSIDTARQSVDGINIDEQTQKLIEYQNAYSAAAQTFKQLQTTMQETLDLISS